MTLGLKDLYYAVCTEADGAESYGTPKKMAEAMSADLSVKTADGSLYADDRRCLIMQNRRAYPLQTLICSWAFYGKNCRDTQQ